MSRTRYDVCILGAGPAGYAAAMRAHDLGKRVALVERDQVGGAGLRNGALSSKTMWHLANDFASARRVDRGYKVRDIELSYDAVMETVRKAVDERQQLLQRQLDALQHPTISGGSITTVRGAGRLVGAHDVEVTRAGETTRLEADNIVIATGSRPRLPDGIEVDGKVVVTSDHIEAWKDFPRSMVVVGAGVVGCEYATVFARYERTKIAMIDQQPRILPFEDEDVARVVAASFERLGVRIHREAKLSRLRVVDGEVEYVICDPSGECQPLRVERALISIGRVPNTRDLGLEALGVQFDKRGGIVVDQTRSSVPHIYAAGDTSPDVALANVAELEGRHAVELMFGLDPTPIRYEAISTIMFLAPEVAAVGLNEQQAKKQGVRYRVAVLDNRLVVRNVAMRSTAGLIKLLATPEPPHRLLGLRVVGPQASSTAQGIAFLIDQGATLVDIDRCLHPHPAVPEGVQECARLLLGRSVLKPEVLGKELLWTGEG